MSDFETSQNYHQFFNFVRAIKNHLDSTGHHEVITPPVVDCPTIEEHIHSFAVTGKYHQGHLHTSPEFWMKDLLSKGFQDPYFLGYTFRDEPAATYHRPQFLMLEWYTLGSSFSDFKKEVFNLIQTMAKSFNKSFLYYELSMRELFQKYLQVDLNDLLGREALFQFIKNHFSHLVIQEHFEWDDLFFTLFLNEIEPQLKEIPFLILSDYPACMAALSKLHEKDSRYAKRFEVYIEGLEIANCYHELTDLEEQSKRFEKSRRLKKNLYEKEMPQPDILLESLKRGLPDSCGGALGVERLYQVLSEKGFWAFQNIQSRSKS